MLERIDIQALPTGALIVFCASTFVSGQRKWPHMSRVQRCILAAQDEHFERIRESGDAAMFVPLDGRNERLHVAKCASHVAVAIRAGDLWEAHEYPRGVHANTVLAFEQTSSSEFNDGVPDAWGVRHLACAQLRHLSDVAAAAVERGGSVYALVPERACGNNDLFHEAYAGIAWRDALRAWVFQRKGQPYESPAMLLGMKFGLGRILRRFVPPPVRETIERWGATCSEMAWEFGRSGLLALSQTEMEAVAAADGQDVWPMDLVLREASPWARARLVLVASARWRGSDDEAAGREGSRRDSSPHAGESFPCPSDRVSATSDAISVANAGDAILPAPADPTGWHISGKTVVEVPGGASRNAVPPIPLRDDVPRDAVPTAPTTDSTVLATPPGSDAEDGAAMMTSATYVALPAPVAAVAAEPAADKMARTPRGGVDRAGALAILAQSTMDDLAKSVTPPPGNGAVLQTSQKSVRAQP